MVLDCNTLGITGKGYMKKLILLSLLSILATGCFSENDETNPFIQSEAEKQVAANYRALVNQTLRISD